MQAWYLLSHAWHVIAGGCQLLGFDGPTPGWTRLIILHVFVGTCIATSGLDLHMLLAGAWRQLALPRPASTCPSWTKSLGQRLHHRSLVQRRQHIAAGKTVAMSKESTPDRDVAQVTEVVGAFLRTADLEVCTEKQVIAHVQKTIGDQLSQPVSAYKKTITRVIEAYLEDMDETEAQAEEEQHQQEEEQAHKGKKRAGGPASGAGTSKRARIPGVDDSDTQFSADLGHKRFARVRTYQGRLQVDIREFYEVRRRCVTGGNARCTCCTPHATCQRPGTRAPPTTPSSCPILILTRPVFSYMTPPHSPHTLLPSRAISPPRLPAAPCRPRLRPCPSLAPAV